MPSSVCDKVEIMVLTQLQHCKNGSNILAIERIRSLLVYLLKSRSFVLRKTYIE